jgi:hypothetical protein
MRAIEDMSARQDRKGNKKEMTMNTTRRLGISEERKGGGDEIRYRSRVQRCGLAAGREYRVRPGFPDSPETQVARRSLAVTVPARQVLLLSIQPSP